MPPNIAVGKVGYHPSDDIKTMWPSGGEIQTPASQVSPGLDYTSLKTKYDDLDSKHQKDKAFYEQALEARTD